MQKKYKLITWFVISSLLIILLTIIIRINNRTVQTKECHILSLSEMKEEIISVEEIQKLDEIDLTIAEMRRDMDQIESISTNMEWFIAYKNVVNKYSYILDPPETVYDYFTDEEIYLIQRAVETECYEQDFDSKCHVANVIFNRINDPQKTFGISVYEVITSPNQFAYGRIIISDDTKLAVEYAFEITDTTNGCIGFHSNDKTNTFNGWDYVFTDEVNHHFYKMKEDK